MKVCDKCKTPLGIDVIELGHWEFCKKCYRKIGDKIAAWITYLPTYLPTTYN